MRSEDFTTEQAATLGRQIGPMLRYLGRLRDRMEKTGFTPSDKLYQLVADAWDRLHRLNVELHYLSCKGGVGRASRE